MPTKRTLALLQMDGFVDKERTVQRFWEHCFKRCRKSLWDSKKNALVSKYPIEGGVYNERYRYSKNYKIR